MAAVGGYGEDPSTETLQVEASDVLESDEAIMEAPVTCVPLSIAEVVDNSWRECQKIIASIHDGLEIQEAYYIWDRGQAGQW